MMAVKKDDKWVVNQILIIIRSDESDAIKLEQIIEVLNQIWT